MRNRIVNNVLIAVGALFSCLTFLPSFLPSLAAWISVKPIFAQILAFPVPVSLGALATISLISIWRIGNCYSSQTPPRNENRNSGKITATLISLLYLPACAVLLFAPNWPLPAPTPPVEQETPATLTSAATVSPGASSNSGNTIKSIRVLSWNTQSQAKDEDMKILLAKYRPDVIFLPETSSYEKNGITSLTSLSEDGKKIMRDYTIFSEGGSDNGFGEIAATTVAVHKRLGQYQRGQKVETTFWSVHLVPAPNNPLKDPTGEALPELLSVHTAPPVPGLMGKWNKDLNTVIGVVEESKNHLIAGGDFNATLRHGVFNQRKLARDVQQEVGGSEPAGTWPSTFWEYAASPIDHILINRNLQAQNFQIVKVGSSDHRAIFSEIRLPSR
ncbi:endonuclease/exonuclease/phosphatase family protein [Actinomycetaceae bacterium TAE3-ERU4]|nr:endonuclease/exonuclease/phosphatase family protein [Actinomycetaceae bacterium TAE3-ERU4]